MYWLILYYLLVSLVLSLCFLDIHRAIWILVSKKSGKTAPPRSSITHQGLFVLTAKIFPSVFVSCTSLGNWEGMDAELIGWVAAMSPKCSSRFALCCMTILFSIKGNTVFNVSRVKIKKLPVFS